MLLDCVGYGYIISILFYFSHEFEWYHLFWNIVEMACFIQVGISRLCVNCIRTTELRKITRWRPSSIFRNGPRFQHFVTMNWRFMFLFISSILKIFICCQTIISLLFHRYISWCHTSCLVCEWNRKLHNVDLTALKWCLKILWIDCKLICV